MDFEDILRKFAETDQKHQRGDEEDENRARELTNRLVDADIAHDLDGFKAVVSEMLDFVVTLSYKVHTNIDEHPSYCIAISRIADSANARMSGRLVEKAFGKS